MVTAAETAFSFHTGFSDQFTASDSEAGLLTEHLENEIWGKTPAEYVEWFDTIWRLGDPGRWGLADFTPGAVMIDSTGRSRGADIAASDFLLLFQYFPELRGQVISWASNDTEIFINWRWVLSDKRTIPVVDKFSFVNGRVSFRVAYFDTVTFLSYLAENYGAGLLIDYFIDRYMRAKKGLGLLFATSLLISLTKGLFFWSPIPLGPPGGLKATGGDGAVSLQWEPVAGAGSYRVKRSTDPSGPFVWIAPKVEGTSYLDQKIQPGTTYYYVVSTNLASGR